MVITQEELREKESFVAETTKELVAKRDEYKEKVLELTEQMKQGKTADHDSAQNNALKADRVFMQEKRDTLDDTLRDLQLKKVFQELGSEKVEAVADETVRVSNEHEVASQKLYAGYLQNGKVDLGVLSEKEKESFVEKGAFRLRPKMAWRSDTGDGETVVETEIYRRAVERLKLYGPCWELFQKFSWPGHDFEVAIGDQTSTLAGTPGSGGNMIDEAYANFNATEVTYNVERKVHFRDRELLAWVVWTMRSSRRTKLPGAGRHMRLLETAMARRVNALLTNSTADGSSEARTSVVGLKTSIPHTLLAANNAIAVDDLIANFSEVEVAYIKMSEDDITMLDSQIASEQVGMPTGTRVDSTAWMMNYDVLTAINTLAAKQEQNNALPWFMDYSSNPVDPFTRLRLFGFPVYLNNDLGGLEQTPGTGTNLMNLVSVFGRFGYMAVADIDMFLEQYGPESGAATFGTQKLSSVGVSCKAFDCNVLSVGPTAGKTEALHGLGTKQT